MRHSWDIHIFIFHEVVMPWWLLANKVGYIFEYNPIINHLVIKLNQPTEINIDNIFEKNSNILKG